MILLIDNYDSFSYNLLQLVGEINPDIVVIRNDEKSISEIEAMNPSHIILSPGPGKPSDAGICEEVVKNFRGKIPILGVCLGHQAICEVYGATVTYASKLMHGKKSSTLLDLTSPIFKGLPCSVDVARYHSLAAKSGTIEAPLKITATTKEGDIMAVEDRANRVYGLQFHPESILTSRGHEMMENFLAQ